MTQRLMLWEDSVVDPLVSWAAFGIYAMLIVALIPHMVTVRSDDFGYLESTIRTFQARWPVNGNWVEAGNVLFASVTALAYWVTRNFYASTFGVLAAFTLGTFWMLNVVLKIWLPFLAVARQFIAFVVVTSPVYLHKSIDFAGAMPAWFFFLLALICFARKNYFGFFLSVIAGSLIRQSAIALLALPAADLLAVWFAERRGAIRLFWRLAPGFATVPAILFLSTHAVKPTYAQVYITDRIFEALNGSSFAKNLTIGLIVALASFVVFRALLSSAATRLPMRERFAADRAAFVTLGVLAGVSLLFVVKPAIYSEIIEGYIPELHGAERGLTVFLMAAAAIALGLRYGISVPWRSPLLVAQLAYVSLTAVRGIWWEYYFFEIVLLSLLLASESLYSKQVCTDLIPLSTVSIISLTAVLICNAFFGVILKFNMDREAYTVALLEMMVREREITPEELKGWPWAYKEWKVFEPWVARNANRKFNFPLGDVLAPPSQWAKDLDQGNVSVRWARSEGSALSDGCVPLRSGKAVFLGVSNYFSVNRCGPLSAQAGILDTKDRIFPLANREWDQYIRQTSRSTSEPAK